MNNGDFIKIEFELRTQDDGKLLATNKEELAKQNDIYNEEMHYGPSVIIVGSDNLLKKVNESFLTAEPDKEVRVEMSPQDAYGERDPKNIKVHTYREFEKNHIDPEVGKEII
ncbi:MAG: FKBP-type peptidyl-prolyl cis-trans isomerase, partial [Candidatus Thermoplasmatota archaeon]|nr:FKBP-type peptidyl-prolyl cis-trans isomerase [Candidatus Thermoplasmatota archaeon]